MGPRDDRTGPFLRECRRGHLGLFPYQSKSRDVVWKQVSALYSTLAAETYDLSPVLKAVRTDGARWYRVDDGSSLAPVESMAMAGIFVIGQRLIDL
ncbi:MAG: hypothetical protein DI603_16380 [Roseateles depolymerans]|uniref:Uncharacterized protein n=1 Tax=Roseateles depolymerans TaxID=76731 RepID=A0A2W5DKI2_9BURK|nr:MAG: hypothetical protein DI603_16380 [Roseateles depolymerans]